jgi:hypothetical protein
MAEKLAEVLRSAGCDNNHVLQDECVNDALLDFPRGLKTHKYQRSKPRFPGHIQNESGQEG